MQQQYSFGVMRLFIDFVLNAAVSLRGSSAVLRTIMQLLPEVERTPSPNGGQLWLLRVGLYELIRRKEQADDWVWIVDHTVQIGVVKCLLVVGCRLRAWQAQRRPLRHGDLSVLALEPVVRSDGALVEQQLECLVQQTGPPRAIVSDHGTDLKHGIERFCAEHAITASLYDIAHRTALELKRQLEAEPRWEAFLRQAGRSKSCLQQTALAHLTPPSPKPKARYMNLEELVGWGEKALAYIESPCARGSSDVDREKLEQKLGWLREYREAFGEWSEVMQVVSETLSYVRMEGYHAAAAGELAGRLNKLVKTAISRRLAESMVAFVADQSTYAGPDERLIGSSEALESLIGKGKRLEGQQSKSGFTKMILGMAAAVVNPTQDYLSAAFQAVRVRDVAAWCQKKLGISVQSQRRRAFASLLAGTKPG